MTRLEVLTLKLADIGLTAGEEAELKTLLADNAAASHEFFAMLDVEAALRGCRTDLDLASGIMQQIELERSQRIQRGVLRDIQNNVEAKAVGAALSRQSPHWGYWLNGGVAAAAMIGIGLWLAFKQPPSANAPSIATKPVEIKTEKPKTVPDQSNSPKIVAKTNEAGTLVFSEDFAAGLPDKWLCGAYETTNLPPGAKGAVRQITKPDVKHNGIYSNQAQKLFDVTPRDVIHLTFRMDKPEAFSVVLVLFQTATGRGGELRYTVIPSSGNWQTLDIPISKFEKSEILATADSEVVCQRYVFDTFPSDLGMVVSRFWVTRETPSIPGK